MHEVKGSIITDLILYIDHAFTLVWGKINTAPNSVSLNNKSFLTSIIEALNIGKINYLVTHDLDL